MTKFNPKRYVDTEDERIFIANEIYTYKDYFYIQYPGNSLYAALDGCYGYKSIEEAIESANRYKEESVTIEELEEVEGYLVLNYKLEIVYRDQKYDRFSLLAEDILSENFVINNDLIPYGLELKKNKHFDNILKHIYQGFVYFRKNSNGITHDEKIKFLSIKLKQSLRVKTKSNQGVSNEH